MNFFDNIPNFNNPPIIPHPNNSINNIDYKFNELENKIMKLEQRIARLESDKINNYIEPDNSMYMI